ncbi:MAG TPA: methyltransferase domain-containing protein [Candidatus Paceibacterota bacterium]|nr:methyltransferase domain-containing protein [Candidatus Paceibacterota bacterium]
MYPRTFGKFAEPKTVASHFHLREGDSVADFGAGSGHYMEPLSALVGRTGSVYLCDIQKNLVDSLGARARERRLSNTHPMWADVETKGGVRLRDEALDAVLISNLLFQLHDREAGLREAARVLRKGGKLIVVDWTDSFGGLGPHPDHVVREADAKALGEKTGFSFERTFPAGDHHYGIVFRKA